MVLPHATSGKAPPLPSPVFLQGRSLGMRLTNTLTAACHQYSPHTYTHTHNQDCRAGPYWNGGRGQKSWSLATGWGVELTANHHRWTNWVQETSPWNWLRTLSTSHKIFLYILSPIWASKYGYLYAALTAMAVFSYNLDQSSYTLKLWRVVWHHSQALASPLFVVTTN